MSRDPELQAHLEWLGYLQPVGLVVSPPALLAAQAHVDRNAAPLQQRFLPHVRETVGPGGEPTAVLTDLPALFREFLGWEAADLVGGPNAEPLPTTLKHALPDYNDLLEPTFAVREFSRETDRERAWILLIEQWPNGTPLDDPKAAANRGWEASPHARFERLLRETRVPAGLLVNGTHLRLVSAPHGETSGHLDFPVQAMAEVAGRPILAAFHMLLCEPRMFSLPPKQRLPHILTDSRRFQANVSTQLAGQVLAALYDLLRGFQAADDQAKGALLRDVLAHDPSEVYKGLLTVLMRLVFLLYAEDRGLMPDDPVYSNSYSVGRLFERLREDAGRYPDTMDQRYGAWAQLLTLFRIVHDGATHGSLKLPPRRGYLFDPTRYPFLEGPPTPRVADGVIHRVLENLLVLGGERLSYRALDVEQIGSVYETMMGFTLERAKGRSIAVRSKGAPVAIDLDALLTLPAAGRAKSLKEQTGQTLTGKALQDFKTATTPEALAAALERRVAREATPDVVPAGGMLLQPSEERRRSGSHYTPRTLTRPIVEKTLQPILNRLGPRPRPQQILDLKVCDPAMGSGAFLVEACRQLGDVLIEAWKRHGFPWAMPSDEDRQLVARRLVAQQCLYGVDRNPMAVDLAKLSLWLVTLAKDLPFTFLNHALVEGDSLVGIVRLDQIRSFAIHPTTDAPALFDMRMLGEEVDTAVDRRQQIMRGDVTRNADVLRREDLLKEADAAVACIGSAGSMLIHAELQPGTVKARKEKRARLGALAVQRLREGEATAFDREVRGLLPGWTPFHWPLRFPEVFDRDNPGFDAIVGNPPFAGKNTIAAANPDGYGDWLKIAHPESHGNADLVAHFFRRAFDLLRKDGAFGLIATNTIGQGDTRSTGLRWICTHGGTIYEARRRLKWPGAAAVVVSVVHVFKGPLPGPYELDGRDVPLITAYLFHAGGHEDPHRLKQNAGKSFVGSYVLGMGFTFDDTDKEGVASPLAEMERLIAKDRRNAERIFPYIGGEEVNDSPTHAHHRYVINFGELSEAEAGKWPDLIRIVKDKVRGTRGSHSTAPWWQLERPRAELYSAIDGFHRVGAVARVGQHAAFTFLPAGMVYSEQLIVFAMDSFATFTVLQSRVHEIWIRFFASSMKDDLRYTPSDCFETFPMPPNFDRDPKLEAAGKAYYEFRADLMVRNNQGLTATYNRFHDPNERSADLGRLRELHAVMDRAVLDAYGWTDFAPRCDFLLDYEEDEDEESSGRQRRKPYRYRWVDEDRDWVLAQLLELNRKRAELERLDPSMPADAADAAEEADDDGPLFQRDGGEEEG